MNGSVCDEIPVCSAESWKRVENRKKIIEAQTRDNFETVFV